MNLTKKQTFCSWLNARSPESLREESEFGIQNTDFVESNYCYNTKFWTETT